MSAAPKREPSESTIALFRKLLVDSSFADLTITVAKEKANAHRAVLAIRCEEIQPMPPTDPKLLKKIKDKGALTLKEGVPSLNILAQVLMYLYTGKVNFPKLESRAILQLRKAAAHFKLDRLEWLCESYLYETMSMDNIFHVLKASQDANEETIKDFCLKYALNHYSEFVTNKNGLHILGIDLFQEVVASQANQARFEKVTLRPEPLDTLVDDFQRLFQTMPYSDLKFIVEGEAILCHKAILAAASDKFIPLVKDAPPNGVEMRALSGTAFKSMLRYIYFGDEQIDALPACELVPFARTYDLPELQRVCENKIRGNVSTGTVLGILEVAYMPEIAHKQDLVEELKSKAFPFILEHLKEIDLGPLKGMNPVIAQDLLISIQEFQRKRKAGGRAWKGGS
jgi:hypothetical protein